MEMEQQQQQQTVVAVAQPLNTASVAQNVREWSTGIFGCCENIGGFCYGYFCYPCLACKVAKRLDENCCMPLCVPGGLMATRTKVRTMYGIKGTICNDYCVTCFCGGLAMCQLDRELTRMGI